MHVYQTVISVASMVLLLEGCGSSGKSIFAEGVAGSGGTGGTAGEDASAGAAGEGGQEDGAAGTGEGGEAGAAEDASPDGDPAEGGGGQDGGPFMHCGADPTAPDCDPGTQSCCMPWQKPQTTANGACVNLPDNCPGSNIVIQCTKPSHCPEGKICCARQVQTAPTTFYYQSILCEDQCEKVFPPASPVCDTEDPLHPCPAGHQCEQSDFLPKGVWICG